jgi:Asp-tRNA(Asn)/Glu-tRNA(Gln) amidotransferase A subunit family amidase
VSNSNYTGHVEDVTAASQSRRDQDSLPQIPQGPYLAHINGNITLTQVYRSYRDEAQAFTAGTIHTEDNTFIDLSTPVSALNALSISVPSRLYTMDLPNARPLEGKRIAVKDLFDMAGLRTGGGNRAYYNTYPAKNVTAVAIQRLVDQVGEKLAVSVIDTPTD